MSEFEYLFRSEAEEADYEAHLAELQEAQHFTDQNAPVGSISENLISFRRRRGLKKVDVARIMGVTARTYFAYENGQRSIPSDALINLAVQTGVDIHQVLMGKPAVPDANIVRAALVDAAKIQAFIEKKHPEMEGATRNTVVRTCITTDWAGWPRVHPRAINAAVTRCTAYNPLHSELPAPPDFRDYRGDSKRYETDLADWERLAEEH